MKEINIGDYVRTDIGIIGKVTKKNGDAIIYEDNNRDYITYSTCHYEIVKSSPNIIDLIEMGDYVNGKRVDNTSLGFGNYIFCGTKRVYVKDIKSIVTKEQFESIIYKVQQ